MSTFEYAILSWVYETNWNQIYSLPEGARPELKFTSRYELWLPGATKGEELEPGDAGLVSILNNLGSKGWRLVEASVLDSVVLTPGFHGWHECGTPVRQRWTFMQERQL